MISLRIIVLLKLHVLALCLLLMQKKITMVNLFKTCKFPAEYLFQTRSKRSTGSSEEVSDIKLEWVTDKLEMKITFGQGGRSCGSGDSRMVRISPKVPQRYFVANPSLVAT